METNQIFIIGIAVVLFLAILAIILLVHENEKKDLQSERDSGVICRNLVRIAKHQEEIEQLEKKIESDQNVIDKLMTRVLGQGIEIEMLEMKQSNEKDLKMAFNDIASEFKIVKSELRIAYERLKFSSIGNDVLIEENRELIKRNEYLKAVKNHKKRPVEVVNSDIDLWECVDDCLPKFYIGGNYRNSGRKTDSNNLIWLKNNGHNYLVHKSSFKPAQL